MNSCNNFKNQKPFPIGSIKLICQLPDSQMRRSIVKHLSSNHHQKEHLEQLFQLFQKLQEAAATLTSIVECLRGCCAANAFIDGVSALCIDFVGNCSTFDKQFLTW